MRGVRVDSVFEQGSTKTGDGDTQAWMMEGVTELQWIIYLRGVATVLRRDRWFEVLKPRGTDRLMT